MKAMKKNLQNQKAFSLLEVTAAGVIGIIVSVAMV